MPDTPKQGLAAPAPAGACARPFSAETPESSKFCPKNTHEIGQFGKPMTLEQAIKHTDEVAWRLRCAGKTACADDHFQLATWLRELLAFREGRKVNQPSPVRPDPFCGMDLATGPSVTVIQVQRFPGETDEQFRDRVNRALAELEPTPPAPTRKKANEEILYYGPRFFIVDIGDKKYVTRSVARPDSARPLTRRELYDGRMGEAQREYAHAFMCTGFPTKEDPTRPTMEAWLAEEPFEFEVDKFVSEKLFSKEEAPCL